MHAKSQPISSKGIFSAALMTSGCLQGHVPMDRRCAAPHLLLSILLRSGRSSSSVRLSRLLGMRCLCTPQIAFRRRVTLAVLRLQVYWQHSSLPTSQPQP